MVRSRELPELSCLFHIPSNEDRLRVRDSGISYHQLWQSVSVSSKKCWKGKSHLKFIVADHLLNLQVSKRRTGVVAVTLR